LVLQRRHGKFEISAGLGYEAEMNQAADNSGDFEDYPASDELWGSGPDAIPVSFLDLNPEETAL
jgi:hypothetical protein